MTRSLLVKMLIIYAAWASIGVACCSNGCCGEDGPGKFNTVGLEVFGVKGEYREPKIWFSYPLTTIQQGDTLEHLYFGLELRIEMEDIAMRSGSIFNNLMACSPADPESVQKLVGLRIVSDSTFIGLDRTFQPGEDLSQLFMPEERFSSVGEMLNHGVIYNNMPVLSMDSGPLNMQAANFRVIMTLDNGAEFIAEGPTVVLH